MEEFAKTIHAFQYAPHDVWGGTARLFDASKDGRYSFVFGDGTDVWTTVPEDRFHALAGIWFVCEYVKTLWKQEKEKRSKDEVAGLALERRYMVYYAVGELLRMIYDDNGLSLDDDLEKLGKPKWTEREGLKRRSSANSRNLPSPA